MIRNVVTAFVMTGLLVAAPAMAANQCRDAKGKFIKCADAAKKPSANATGSKKGKDGKCRVASGPKKGQFTKC